MRRWPGTARRQGMAGIMAALCAAAPAGAAMYECLGPSGATVFTDSPAQLRNCTPLGSGHPVPMPPPPAAALPQSPPMMLPHSPADLVTTPAHDPHDLANAAPTGPAPDRDIGPPTVEAVTGTASPEGTELKRCASSVNPLNPLAARPCKAPDPPAPPAPPTEPVNADAPSAAPGQ